MTGDDVFPDRDMSHREKIEFMLERQGWAIDAVPATADPPFPRYAHTIGFEDRFAFPDLCVFGLAPVACQGLFALLADALDGGTELPVGVPFIGLLEDDQPCALLPVEPTDAEGLFPSLAEHQRLADRPADQLRVLQLVWPDPEGRLPWERGFAEALLAVQILVGEPPTS